MGAWDICANRHLLAYLMRKIALRSAKYSAIETDRLIAAKHAWAADMRDEPDPRNVPVERQKAVWAEYIAGAESEIADMRRGVAA